MEASRRAKVVEGKFEHLKEALAKMKVDLALKKEMRKAKAIETREKLVEEEKKVTKRTKIVKAKAMKTTCDPHRFDHFLDISGYQDFKKIVISDP